MKNTLIILVLFTTTLIPFMAVGQLYPKLNKYVSGLSAEFDLIGSERKEELIPIKNYIVDKIQKKEKVQLLYVCTHNSRRSHMAQAWTAAAAVYYDIANISTYSGGTEATAFNINAINALKRAGFKIDENPVQDAKNPNYYVKMGTKIPPIQAYSKKYSDPFNPGNNFGAIMVCSEADKSCPIVPGATGRFGLPYDDPKAYDNTPAETEEYNKTCRLIAREMLFVMYSVKNEMTKIAELSK